MHTQTLEYIFLATRLENFNIIGFYFVHFSIYLSIPHCVYCWWFIIHFASWWGKCPFIISFPLCVPQRKGTISWSWPSALLLCYQVSLATLSPLLCYRERAEGFAPCFIASVILTLETVPSLFSRRNPSVQTIFSVMFFCWKLAGCEIGSEAYLTSHSFDHLTSCSFSSPFHTASYLSLHPWKSQALAFLSTPSLWGM